MTLLEKFQVAGLLVLIVLCGAICVAISALLGAIMLGPTLALIKADSEISEITGYILNGLPWLYVLWRFGSWIRDNLKQQDADRLGWKDE